MFLSQPTAWSFAVKIACSLRDFDPWSFNLITDLKVTSEIGNIYVICNHLVLMKILLYESDRQTDRLTDQQKRCNMQWTLPEGNPHAVVNHINHNCSFTENQDRKMFNKHKHTTETVVYYRTSVVFIVYVSIHFNSSLQCTYSFMYSALSMQHTCNTSSSTNNMACAGIATCLRFKKQLMVYSLFMPSIHYYAYAVMIILTTTILTPNEYFSHQ